MCDKPCNLIVDTGADISIIKENTLEQLQNIYPQRNCIINVITKGSIESVGKTYTNILINNFKIPHEFQVVEKDFPISPDGILGKYFLSKYGCNIYLKSWIISFDFQDETFEIPINDKQNNSIIIPPRCQIIRKLCIYKVN